MEIKPGEPTSEVIEGQPTQLMINRRLTGGLDRDGAPGDEGIMVAVEPRDAEGHVVKGPGAVSVVLMDPSLAGDAARIARWDFAAEEVPSHFHNTFVAKGLQFELPWPDKAPANRDLRLFVRYTTPDGNKIMAEAPIDVRLPTEAQLAEQSRNRASDSAARRSASARWARGSKRDCAATTRGMPTIEVATRRRIAVPVRRRAGTPSKPTTAMTIPTRRRGRIGRCGGRIDSAAHQPAARARDESRCCPRWRVGLVFACGVFP